MMEVYRAADSSMQKYTWGIVATILFYQKLCMAYLASGVFSQVIEDEWRELLI